MCVSCCMRVWPYSASCVSEPRNRSSSPSTSGITKRLMLARRFTEGFDDRKSGCQGIAEFPELLDVRRYPRSEKLRIHWLSHKVHAIERKAIRLGDGVPVECREEYDRDLC